MAKFIAVQDTRSGTRYINMESISEISVFFRKVDDADGKRKRHEKFYDIYLNALNTSGERINIVAKSISNANKIDRVTDIGGVSSLFLPVADGHVIHYMTYSYEGLSEEDKTPISRYYGYQSAALLGWVIDPANPDEPTPATAFKEALFDDEDIYKGREYWVIEHPDGRVTHPCGEEVSSVAEWVAAIIETLKITDEHYTNIGSELPTVKPTAVNVPKTKSAASASSSTKPSQGKTDDMFKPR